VQHIVHHLAPTGHAGFVLANGSMSSNQSGEREIRKNLVEADLVDCIVALPGQLFYSTQIPACLWFLARNKKNGKYRDRRGHVLFLDARKLGRMVDRIHRELTDEEIARVTAAYHAWRGEKEAGEYADIPGVCKSTMLEEMRLGLVAPDIVSHFEERLDAMDGKAMVVCMSRRICMDLHDQIVKLRPDWLHEDDDAGVRGPMRGHGLMQAIARVNRVFRDKPGGLVVDYLGLAHELKAALATYTESGGTGKTAIDQQEAVAAMLEKHEVCCGLFHGFDRSKWVSGTPGGRLSLLPEAQEHILEQEDGKNRLLRAVHELSQAFALAVPHEEALRIRDDVAFFQAVRASLAKRAPGEARTEKELDHAVRQIVSRAVASEGVVDIFAAAGLKKPDIAILSEEFLAEVRGIPQRNLAVELLRKLLSGEVRSRRRRNVVQARSFAKMLERSIRRYQNRAIEAEQVIEELIAPARHMREADARGEQLALSKEELAVYDALETKDSAVKVLGDETLRGIARELVATVRANVTIDWTVRENVRAHLRVLVKRILRKHGYPPDKQEKATQTVLEQAEVLSQEWAAV
jgi:type I site-specific restriction-modification system R (restriction) subunit